MKTPAVVFPAAEAVEFRLIDVPAPRDDEAVVRTEWSWISNGTEGSFLRGERHDGETPSSPTFPAPFPIVPGYQRVGVVETAGPESGVKPGQRVFATLTRVEGLATATGGHVLRGPVHRDQLYPLPTDGPPPEAYAGLVLAQVGYNCAMRPPLSEAESLVVVLGDGQVGHWAAQTAAERGAAVLVLGRHNERLRFAPRDTANVRDADVAETVKAWLWHPLEAILDTVGDNDTLRALVPLLRRGGHLVSAGFLGPRGAIDIQLLRRREATLHCPSGWTRPRLEATLEWVRAGRLDTLGLVTHRLPADRVGEAWRLIINERATTLGVLLDWRGVTG